MNKIFKLLIIGMLLALSLVMNLTFFKAFSVESKSVLVTINESNEAWIEAIIFPLIALSGIYLFYKESKEFYNEEN